MNWGRIGRGIGLVALTAAAAACSKPPVIQKSAFEKKLSHLHDRIKWTIKRGDDTYAAGLWYSIGQFGNSAILRVVRLNANGTPDQNVSMLVANDYNFDQKPDEIFLVPVDQFNPDHGTLIRPDGYLNHLFQNPKLIAQLYHHQQQPPACKGQ